MSDLRDIIARLEKATGPDRFLDAIIDHRVNDWTAERSGTTPDGEDFVLPSVPHYTASIDAALTLVPESRAGWHVACHNDEGSVCYCASVDSSQVWWGATPAIALCIAALKARESAAHATSASET